MISVRFFSLVFLILVFLWPTASFGENQPEPDSAQRTEFANGVQLLVLPQPNEFLVQIDVFLSLRGAPRIGGMAHLVEHLMFQSSENCPAGSLRDSLQLLTTYHQGFTSPRNIQTRSRCLPSLLPRLLVVEAERFGRLKPDEDGLELEKNRILGEMDFRNETIVAQALDLRVLAMAYGSEQTGDPLLGSAEFIRSLEISAVDSFITRWVRPEKLVVLISGPIDPDLVVPMVRETFGTLPATSMASPPKPLPEPPGPRNFVTHSGEDHDLLAVGFRLPYGTGEEAAMVHLIETIMERENGHPLLWIFDDEAMLIVHVTADWSENRTDDSGAEKARDQFLDETRRVMQRIGDDWLFKRNRSAHVEAMHQELKRPLLRASWRAQALADGRELPDSDLMVAIVDSLGQDRIQAFFQDEFTPSRAFFAYAAGRAPKNEFLAHWNRDLRLLINPYLLDPTVPSGLGPEQIEAVLEAASCIAGLETVQLVNGIPVHFRDQPGVEEIFIGGVKTFFPLYEESRTQFPGRLILYWFLANSGYDQKGGSIAPVGQEQGWSTQIHPWVNSLEVTAFGQIIHSGDVIAAMHKRMAVDHLDPYVLWWLIENRKELVDQYFGFPAFRSSMWLQGAVFGPDHPLACWLHPDSNSIAQWSIDEANQMHKKICWTGNFQLVVSGDFDRDVVRRQLESTFGKLPQSQPGAIPAGRSHKLTGKGVIVHSEGSAVAVVDFMFPPRPLYSTPVMNPVDVLVLESLLETRIRMAATDAGVDSVSVAVFLQPQGASALPQIRVVTRVDDAARTLELIKAEAGRLRDDPPSREEVALARLGIFGALLEMLREPETARNLFLDFGLFGQIPTNPLRDLGSLEYEVAAEQATRILSRQQHVWTVTGDTTRTEIQKLGRVLN